MPSNGTPNGRPRIAIPLPHSFDEEYAQRSIPQYERAVEQAGGEPVPIALDRSPAEVATIIAGCDGVLLPGSKADVDPARFRAPRSPHTATADPRRDTVDELLLRDAYRARKPVLGICYGLQSLNVFRAGSLIQHIPDFLPDELRARVNHDAGKEIAIAHSVDIEKNSRLAEILCRDSRPRLSNRAQLEVRKEPSLNSQPALSKRSGPQSPDQSTELNPASEKAALTLPVNSSHHQSAGKIGEGLRITARCSEDGIVEAIEGTDPDHFVLAVQWHPERSIELDEASREIFRNLIAAAK